MTTVLLPSDLAAQHGAQIRAVAPDDITLLAVENEEELPSLALDTVEIVFHGTLLELVPLEALLQQAPNIRWIHSLAAGVEHLASPLLTERRIVLTNSAGVYAPAMAEYVVSAMVLMSRKWREWLDLHDQHDWVKRGGGRTLHGSTVGLVGYGSVARHIAYAARALGMTVWASKRTPMLASSEPVDVLFAADDLDTLLAGSDFVVITASLNASTRHLLGQNEFELLKSTAVLINVARGAILDEAALELALREGRIAGAVIDVTETEPLPRTSPLWEVPNLVITPHIAGETDEGWPRSVSLFTANLKNYLAGRPDLMGNVVAIDRHH